MGFLMKEAMLRFWPTICFSSLNGSQCGFLFRDFGFLSLSPGQLLEKFYETRQFPESYQNNFKSDHQANDREQMQVCKNKDALMSHLREDSTCMCSIII